MKRETKRWAAIFCIILFVFLIMGCASKPATITEYHPDIRSVEEFTYVLETYRDAVLANRNGEKLRTQIMTFSFVEGNRVFFCTTSDKPLYAQLRAFPYVSYVAFPPDWEPVVSLNGKVVFTEDVALKTRALESNYYALRNFRTIDNPLLRVFYIDVEEIETYATGGPNIYRTSR